MNHEEVIFDVTAFVANVVTKVKFFRNGEEVTIPFKLQVGDHLTVITEGERTDHYVEKANTLIPETNCS